MKILIITASRYNCTRQAGQWIQERLAFETELVDHHSVQDAPSLENYDLIILGSGIYNHEFLPELNSWIDENLELLKQKRISLFATAMKTEPVYVRGMVHGGLAMLNYLFEKLGSAVVHAEILPGQMSFESFTDEDKLKIDNFYKMLKYPPEKIAELKKPRTLMCKKDYWTFAEQTFEKASQCR